MPNASLLNVCTLYLLYGWSGLFLHELLHQCSPGVCWGAKKSQVHLIVSFSFSASLVLVTLLLDPIDPLWGSGQASFLFVHIQWSHGHWSRGWYFWQWRKFPSSSGKWNQDPHKALQQREAQVALTSPDRQWCWFWTQWTNASTLWQLHTEP